MLISVLKKIFFIPPCIILWNVFVKRKKWLALFLISNHYMFILCMYMYECKSFDHDLWIKIVIYIFMYHFFKVFFEVFNKSADCFFITFTCIIIQSISLSQLITKGFWNPYVKINLQCIFLCPWTKFIFEFFRILFNISHMFCLIVYSLGAPVGDACLSSRVCEIYGTNSTPLIQSYMYLYLHTNVVSSMVKAFLGGNVHCSCNQHHHTHIVPPTAQTMSLKSYTSLTCNSN